MSTTPNTSQPVQPDSTGDQIGKLFAGNAHTIVTQADADAANAGASNSSDSRVVPYP